VLDMHSRNRRSVCRALLLWGIWMCGAVASVAAHEGPPFPILMDQPAADYRVSVWADPDIGEAYFYVIVETPNGDRPDRVPAVSMWTEPVSGRLERVEYDMEQQELRSHLQFEAKPYFDQRDMWNVGFRLESSDGDRGELVAEVESTPPGFGAWDLAVYLFPFVFLGGMWVLAILRRSRSARGPDGVDDASQLDVARLKAMPVESAAKD